ncbi:MAG: hypothetical protein BGO13_09175 [Burkholderiales bacterium 66-5]|nr:MAG: hypothetical protein BGO13_09175 [Burkholderiales bacterium 66-5]
MTSRYNLLPNATHFMPFGAGLNAGLHYSYTNAAMYCRRTVRISDESFDYVEMRTLAEDSLPQLHAMAANDFIGPASHFSRLEGDERACEALEEGFRQLRLVASERSKLREDLESLTAESEQYQEVMCQLDMLGEDASGVLSTIEKVIDAFNLESGFDPGKGFITMSKG